MFSKDIKVVFNWIGPKGPIPNTEVPNVLNLASVAESGFTNSQKVWNDSIWHLFFCNQPGYDIGSTTFLNQNDIFIFPMQLVWRIEFYNYFYYTSGLLEYSDTSHHTINHIRSNKGFLLIEHSAEAHITKPHLDIMQKYFDEHSIPKDKIIYLTGCANGDELYEFWCMEKGIEDPNNKMIVIPYPVSQQSIAKNYFLYHKPQVPEYDTERVPEKLFLSWNRRFREHRTSIAIALDKLGLVDRSYVSMCKTDPESSLIPFPELNDWYVQLLDINNDDRDNFLNKLPLVLDGETDNNQMCQDFDDATRPYYQNSLVSIVTETNFDALEVSLTEKSFKPCKEKHPFIIAGAPGVLRCMRKWGYKTFGDFWDESYDIVNDPRERLKRIIDVCKYIASWNDDQIREFRRKVKPILDHNYENLKVPAADLTTKLIKEKMYEVLSRRYGPDL